MPVTRRNDSYMQLEVGAVFEGKVTGITKFGAFVSLPDGRSGLVHISEIANTYVNDVRDHLTEGAEVKVKVLRISDDGKVNLSIKKAEEPERRRGGGEMPRQRQYAQNTQTKDASFEDKLKQFIQEADNKISGNRHYDRKSGSRKRR